MANVREFHRPQPMEADASYVIGGAHMGGFLAVTDGTLTVTANDASATVLVDAVPVTAGIFTPIPVQFDPAGATITLAGGASGTLMV